jgi:two-component system cell cycle sensor histidine kinase/response regulator CckA
MPDAAQDPARPERPEPPDDASRTAASELPDIAQFLQAAPLAMVILDLTRGRVAASNAAFTELTGLRPAADAPLASLDGIWLHDRDRDQVYGALAAAERLNEHAVQLRTSWGGVTPVLLNALQQTVGDASFGVCFFTDVSDLKRVELQFQQSQKMEALGSLSGGVAHDFNNLLGAIKGYAELLRESARETPERETVADYSERILSATRIAADLTHKLLVFARSTTLDLQTVNMHELITHAIGILEHGFDKRIDISTDLRAQHVHVTGDRTQLENAVINLCINARDAMPEGGWLRVRTSDFTASAGWCSVQSLPVEPGPYVRIDVEDTGSGIPDAFQQSIFEPFFSTKETGKGTGLGLAAVYGTLSSHRGTVRLDSQVGRGSCFSLYLPAAAAAAPAESPDRPEMVAGTGRLLLVDDEALLRTMTGEMLERLGYVVTAVADGVAAVERFRADPNAFDGVLLDMTMPRMNGRDTQRALRSIRPDLPVLLMSGYTHGAELQEALEEGAMGIVHKPFQFAELAQLVARLLGGVDAAD